MSDRRVSFYASLVGGGLRSEDPPQEAPVVFGYIEIPREHYTPNIYKGVYTHYYIGHENTQIVRGGVDVVRHTVGGVSRGPSGFWI